jgi:hypothetical protein
MCSDAWVLSLMTCHNSLMEAQIYKMENSFLFPHYIFFAKCVPFLFFITWKEGIETTY